MDRGPDTSYYFPSMTKRQTWEAAWSSFPMAILYTTGGPLVLPRLRRSLAVDRLGALNGGRIVRLGLRGIPF